MYDIIIKNTKSPDQFLTFQYIHLKLFLELSYLGMIHQFLLMFLVLLCSFHEQIVLMQSKNKYEYFYNHTKNVTENININLQAV